MALSRSEIIAIIEKAILTDIVDDKLLSLKINEEWLNENWLFQAAGRGHLNAIKFLLQQGLPPDIRDNEGHTPICRAVSEGHISVVNELLKAGANANASDSADFPPLFRAAEIGRLDIVKLLTLHGADVHQGVRRYKNNLGQTAIHAATIQGEIAIVKFLVEEASADPDTNDNYNFTPLHLACIAKHEELATYLLQKGALANQLTSDGRSPLYLCIENYSAPHSTNIAQSLIRYGANTKGLLHFAVSSEDNHEALIHILLMAGEDIDARDEQQNTPLHTAVLSGNTKNLQFLLQNGAKLDALNAEGKTPLEICLRSNLDLLIKLEMITCFIEAGADINKPDEHNNSLHKIAEEFHPLILELFLRGCPHVNRTNDYGEAPIHVAAKRAQYENIIILLDAGAKIDERLKRMTTLLPTSMNTSGQLCLAIIAEKENKLKEAFTLYKKASQQTYPDADLRAALLLISSNPAALGLSPDDRDQRIQEHLEYAIGGYLAKKDFNNLMLAAMRLERCLIESSFSPASFNPVFLSMLPHMLDIADISLLPPQRLIFSTLLYNHEPSLRKNEQDTSVLERTLNELIQSEIESELFEHYFKKEREQAIRLRQFVEESLKSRAPTHPRFGKLEGYKTSSMFKVQASDEQAAAAPKEPPTKQGPPSPGKGSP